MDERRPWGRAWIVLFSNVTSFEDNVSTILSPIVDIEIDRDVL